MNITFISNFHWRRRLSRWLPSRRLWGCHRNGPMQWTPARFCPHFHFMNLNLYTYSMGNYYRLGHAHQCTIPVDMPAGPISIRCCQHRTASGPALVRCGTPIGILHTMDENWYKRTSCMVFLPSLSLCSWCWWWYLRQRQMSLSRYIHTKYLIIYWEYIACSIVKYTQ